jgi:hypothetical protein
VKKSFEMRELPVIACSLSADEMPERRRRWRTLLEGALLERIEIPAGVRLELRSGEGVEAELRALAALERECCAFASFDVRETAGRVMLDVISSADGVSAVRQLFL